MYEVDPSRWIRVATMHFSGRAMGWLQDVDRRVRFCHGRSSVLKFIAALGMISINP
jgi:hypothetical protein